jgi:hypothetical protein
MVQKKFVNTILEVLSPISNITTVKSKGFVGLYKDKVMFGKIISQSVLFLSDDNKFIEVETELITRLLRPKNKIDQSDLDIFLFEANKAWCLAKGKTITISNIKDIFNKDLICSKAIINYKYNFVY